jgi:hypothetical protein
MMWVGTRRFTKGDKPGHAFRGNQWTNRGGQSAETKPEKKKPAKLPKDAREIAMWAAKQPSDNINADFDDTQPAKVTVDQFSDGKLAVGNCGLASRSIAGELRAYGIDARVREVGQPDSLGDDGGTHYVVQVGPIGGEDSFIIDYTISQFGVSTDFPVVATESDYASLLGRTKLLTRLETGE